MGRPKLNTTTTESAAPALAPAVIEGATGLAQETVTLNGTTVPLGQQWQPQEDAGVELLPEAVRSLMAERDAANARAAELQARLQAQASTSTQSTDEPDGLKHRTGCPQRPERVEEYRAGADTSRPGATIQRCVDCGAQYVAL